jgi:hypothetical protein
MLHLFSFRAAIDNGKTLVAVRQSGASRVQRGSTKRSTNMRTTSITSNNIVLVRIVFAALDELVSSDNSPNPP